MSGASAAAVEMADTALLFTTPDVVAVRAAKRTVRMWDRLQIRKAEETTIVVNRYTRGTEIQPALIQRITGTAIAATAIPANFKELQGAVDAGRLHELDNKSVVKQALWGLAGELGLVKVSEVAQKSGRLRGGGDRGSVSFRRRRE
jgi:pilus assembly protein CpaE